MVYLRQSKLEQGYIRIMILLLSKASHLNLNLQIQKCVFINTFKKNY